MFAVAPYLVEITDKRKQPQDLWHFLNGETLHQVLHEYYDQNKNKYQTISSETNKMFMVSKMFTGTSTSVSGVYKTGQFGFESQIYSINERKVTHERKSDEADMMPFNFSFYLPKNTTPGLRKRGLLLLSRFNTLGVRRFTIPHLQDYFSKRFNDLTLNIERVVPQKVMETIMKKGELKNIRLIKKTLPKDVADALSPSNREKVKELELIIRSKNKTFFSDINWILDALEGRTPPNQLFTTQLFEHDNIKLEIEVEGRKRTIDIGRPNSFSSNIELDDITADVDGHPKISDWLKAADELAAEIVTSWGVEGVTWQSAE